MDLAVIEREAEHVLAEVIKRTRVGPGKLLVIGCSTSVVVGSAIGNAGSTDVAAVLYAAFSKILALHKVDPAWQCCEHLNRALVLSRDVQLARGYEPVSVVPIPGAGGRWLPMPIGRFTKRL